MHTVTLLAAHRHAVPASGSALAISVKGTALIIAGVLAAFGLTQLAHDRTPRLAAWQLAGAAFLAAVGATIWTDALASLAFTSLPGLITLAAATVISGLCMWHQATIKDSHEKFHHEVVTPVLAVIFGTGAYLFIGAVGTIIRRGLLNPVTTAQAVGSSAYRLGSGKATQAGVAMSHGERNTVIAAVVAALVAALVAAKKLSGRSKKTGRGRQAAATGPRPAGAIPGRRPAAARPAPPRRGLPTGQRR